MLSRRTVPLLAPLLLTLACAAQPAPVSQAPACEEEEPAIAVRDPVSPESVLVVPHKDELLTLRVFVVSPGDDIDAALPEPIRESQVCKSAGCSLLLSPKLLGRNRRDMALEVGAANNEGYFALEASPSIVEDHVELKLEAQFLAAGQTHPPTQHFNFEGTLAPGQITHVGTFHANSRDGHVVGPQVFAVVERATPEA